MRNGDTRDADDEAPATANLNGGGNGYRVADGDAPAHHQAHAPAHRQADDGTDGDLRDAHRPDVDGRLLHDGESG
jgi:hypothetical protein